MRRQKSFLMTIFPSESPKRELCGQVKSVSTGKTFNFSNLEELQKLLIEEVSSEKRTDVRQDTTPIVEPI